SDDDLPGRRSLDSGLGWRLLSVVSVFAHARVVTTRERLRRIVRVLPAPVGARSRAAADRSLRALATSPLHEPELVRDETDAVARRFRIRADARRDRGVGAVVDRGAAAKDQVPASP